MMASTSVVADLTYAWLDSHLPATLSYDPDASLKEADRAVADVKPATTVYEADVAELAASGKPLTEANIDLLRHEDRAWKPPRPGKTAWAAAWRSSACSSPSRSSAGFTFIIAGRAADGPAPLCDAAGDDRRHRHDLLDRRGRSLARGNHSALAVRYDGGHRL